MSDKPGRSGMTRGLWMGMILPALTAASLWLSAGALFAQPADGAKDNGAKDKAPAATDKAADKAATDKPAEKPAEAPAKTNAPAKTDATPKVEAAPKAEAPDKSAEAKPADKDADKSKDKTKPADTATESKDTAAKDATKDKDAKEKDGKDKVAKDKVAKDKAKAKAPKLTSREALFARLDVNHDQAISRIEYETGQKEEEGLPTKSFKELDLDGNESLVMSEFIAGYTPWWQPVLIGLGMLIVPTVLTMWLTSRLRMPDIGWRLWFVLFFLIGSTAVTAWYWPPKLGIDLKGGVTLIYKVDRARSEQLMGGKLEANFLDSLVSALNRRVNPGGQKEVILRAFGEEQVEIVIPDATEVEIESIKKRVRDAGFLEFRIAVNAKTLANTFKGQGEEAVKAAQKADAPNEVSIKLAGEDKVVARWIDVDLGKNPNIEITEERTETSDRLILRRNHQGILQALMSEEELMPGSELAWARDDHDELGKPCVQFDMNARGAETMGRITSANLPRDNQHSRLAVIYDGKLYSAPVIQSAIFGSGRITGNFSQLEVTAMVGVLQAGRLPAVVSPEPIQEYRVGATLGDDTTRQATLAMLISTALILVFMALYYRFCGIVACLALLFNILITLAAIMFVQAPLTLPGLAGLALTVGMAVDASVLIFERMREEQTRGASLRMVIRNGFDRAFVTIFDSNVTTIITGLVLYAIGSDQVKGFAVTLIIGLFANLFTAITFSRIIFDVFEKKRWLTSISMTRMLPVTAIDFVGKQRACLAGSALLIGIGIVAAFSRGVTLLDIDFAGGTSVHVLFDEDKPVAIGEMRRESSILPDATVSAVGEGSTHYKVDTSLGNESSIRLTFDARDADKNGSLSKEEFLSQFPGKPGTPAYARSEARFAELDASANNPPDGKITREEFTINAEDVKTYWLEAIFGERLRHNSLTIGAIESISTTTPSAKPADGKQPDAKAQSRNDLPADNVLALADSAAIQLAQADDKGKDDKGKDAKPAETKPAETTLSDGKTETKAPVNVNALELQTKAAITFKDAVLSDDLVAMIRQAAVVQKLGEVRVRSTQTTITGTQSSTGWSIETSLPADQLRSVLAAVQARVQGEPLFPAANSIGGQVAGKTQANAIIAIIVSLIAIIIYVWIRFQRVSYGVAAVAALVHDVLIALGFLALSAYFVTFIPGIEVLGVQEFKINLPVVAAFLTIIGFSINDTIVIFDRMRELRGKLPRLTPEIVNNAVNQMLGRTILTSLTVTSVVIIMYIWGGHEIHGFAFAMLVGLISGVYSTVYIATPIVLWLDNPPEPVTAGRTAAIQSAGGSAPAR